MTGPQADEREQALNLQAAGRFEEAAALLERRARAGPRDPGAWADLAACLAAARRPEAALAAYDCALGLAPDQPALLAAKARVLQGLSRVAQAESLMRRALARDPMSFEAAFGLALLRLEAGDWSGAGGAAEGLRQRYGALPELAWLQARAELGRGEADAAERRTRQLLADPRLSPAQRADALLLLGQALDAQGRPAEGLEAAIEGKEIQHGLYAERAAGREGIVQRLERLRAWFEAADPLPWREPAPASRSPARAHVFILGFPRSGTTLLEQALAGHPEVVALEEAPTLAAAQAEFLSSDGGLERLARLEAGEIEAWRRRYWRVVADHGRDPRGRVFVDKAPAETQSLPLIARLFPDARVLFALRDPRDVVLSCLRQGFQLNAMTYAFTRLQDAAACYDRCMALAEVYRRVLPLELHEVRHEALVDDFDGELGRIASLLGLDLRPGMLNVAATAARRHIRTPSAPQVRAGLNARGVGRWRANAEQLRPVAGVLEPWVRRFGYAQ